jgi:hypothetical protein
MAGLAQRAYQSTANQQGSLYGQAQQNYHQNRMRAIQGAMDQNRNIVGMAIGGTPAAREKQKADIWGQIAGGAGAGIGSFLGAVV